MQTLKFPQIAEERTRSGDWGDRHLKPLLVALVIFLYAPFAYYHGVKLVPGGSVDYTTYHYAAVMVFLEGKAPYAPGSFDLAAEQMGTLVHPYVYPPPSLLAFAPLALLSYSPGKALLIVASHLCYLWAIWLLLTRLIPYPRENRLRDITIILSLAYLFFFDPAIVTLQIGQINLIVLPFLFLALVGMRRNAAAWQIALPLSIAILLKTYPAVLFLPLLFRKQFKAVALTCVFYGAYAAVAALVLPADVWSTWYQYVVPKGGYTVHEAAGGPWNQNINAFISRLLIGNQLSESPLPFPGVAKAVATAMAAAVLGITALLSWRMARRDGSRDVSDAEIAAFLLAIFLIAPLSWEHHLVFILPAAVLAISLLLGGQLRRRAAAVVIAALCLIAWRVPFADESLRHGWWTLLISIKFYAAVALWAFFVTRLRAERNWSARAPSIGAPHTRKSPAPKMALAVDAS